MNMTKMVTPQWFADSRLNCDSSRSAATVGVDSPAVTYMKYIYSIGYCQLTQASDTCCNLHEVYI